MTKIHETQPDEKPIVNNGELVGDERLREIQNIEGGGPLKKVDWKAMPKPVRVFGYFFVACVVLMGIFGIIVSFF